MLVREKIAKFGGLKPFSLVFIKDFVNSAPSQWQSGVKTIIGAVSDLCQKLRSWCDRNINEPFFKAE